MSAADTVLHKRLAASGPADLDLRSRPCSGPISAAPAAPPPPGITPLRALAGKVARLLDAVDGADASSLAGRGAGFAQIEPMVEAALAAWTALQAQVPPAP